MRIMLIISSARWSFMSVLLLSKFCRRLSRSSYLAADMCAYSILIIFSWEGGFWSDLTRRMLIVSIKYCWGFRDDLACQGSGQSCQKIMSINCLSLLLNEWQLWWAPPLWCSPPLTPAACCCSSTSCWLPTQIHKKSYHQRGTRHCWEKSAENLTVQRTFT